MTFRKAIEAMAETRRMHIKAETHPVEWNESLAMQQMVEELDQRLSGIEQTQAKILQALQRSK